MYFLKERYSFKREKTTDFKYTVILMENITDDYDFYNYNKIKQ